MIFLYRMRRNSIVLEGERATALDLARGRLVLFRALCLLMAIVFCARVFDLSIIQGRRIFGDNGVVVSSVERVDPESPQAKNTNGKRGDIVDRNGALLATTLRTSSLFADPYLISDPQGTAKGLVKIFPDLSYGEVLQKLQSEKRFVWLKRNLSPAQQYAVLGLGEPGLEFEAEYQRFYPQGTLAVHLIGYGDLDGHGLSGIERGFDKILSEGKPLRLSLDIRFQHALRREVARAMEDFTAIGGAGVVMDVRSGEILAGVSLPDFNPHQAGTATDDVRFSRLTLGAYEMGSVFKIFSTAAFFETREADMNTTFDASVPLRVGRFVINDYHAQDRILTIPEVFMYSSNIGSALMGQAVGAKNLKGFYTDLGLLTPLDFEVREVAAPMVPDPWREVSTLTASYGHGVATTPLQVVTAVSSIINGGYLVKPRLVLDEEAQSKVSAPQAVRVVSPQTAEKMRELFRLVVTDGTGSNADVKGYRVGGKTGTADKSTNGRYDGDKKISSFVGVFPMDDPRYAIFIMVDEPKGTKKTYGYATGGWVAAPAVARYIASMVSILGLPPAPETAVENHFGEDLKQYVSAKKGAH